MARIFGFAGLVVIAVNFTGKGMADLSNAFSGKLMSVMTLLVFALFGYIFAWFQEKLGGIVMTFSGVLLGLYVFYDTGKGVSFVSFVFTLILLVPGILFWVAGSKTDPLDFDQDNKIDLS